MVGGSALALFLFAAGLASLLLGAELLVRGASRLAAVLGVPPLIIGLTVVAFGTSTPELAVSVKASLAGQTSIAVGNVVGSNVFNVLFILGLSSLVAPLVVSQQLIRYDVPVMILVSLATMVLGWDGRFGRIDGLLLFAALVVYVAALIHFGKKSASRGEPSSNGEASGISARRVIQSILLVAVGFVLLVLGSRWLVDAAVRLAEHLGVSQLVVGLTIVAAGTSLPEVVTSVVASIRRERDIAVGNVVGSNIFNIMGVLGLAAVVAPHGIEVSKAVLRFDIPVMIAVAFACLPIFFTGGVISRWEGGLLLGYYIAYTAYLIMAATAHDALAMFGAAMLYFVLPLTALTLAVVTFNAIRKGRRASS